MISIPRSIKLHELPAEARERPPVNPNIPFARGKEEEEEQEVRYTHHPNTGLI